MQDSNYGVMLFYNRAILTATSKEQIRDILCKAAQARFISELYFSIISHFADNKEASWKANHV